jgi:hypothetical protein
MSGETLEVTWGAEGLEVLTLSIAEATLRSLMELPDAFTLSTFAHALGDHPDARRLSDVLLEHGVMMRVPEASAVVHVWHGGSEYERWRLPSSRELDIRLLAGTDQTLAEEFGPFAARQPDTAFVGPVALRHRDVLVGPLRWRAEVEPFLRRCVRTEWIPAAIERRLLAAWMPRVRALLEDCLVAGSWYALTTQGLTEEHRSRPHPLAYEVNHTQPAPAHIRLCYFEASIEDGGMGSGTARDVSTARAVAVGEASERYALDRRDLALGSTLQRLTPAASIHTAYLDRLAPDHGDPLHSCTITPLYRDRPPAAVPTSWIYTEGSPSVANSNGAAHGETFGDAIEAAMREVIERDLFMRVWLGLAGSRQVDDDELLETDDAYWRLLTGEQGLNPVWYRLDSGEDQKCTVVACAVFGETAPFVSFGAACRSSLAAAVEKSFFEAAGVRTLWSSEIERLGRKGFCERALEFATDSGTNFDLVNMGWRWAADPVARERIHERFTARLPPAAVNLYAGTAWYADITPPNLRAGFVAKVLDTEALPLPSCYEHLRLLANMLDVDDPLPIPLT